MLVDHNAWPKNISDFEEPSWSTPQQLLSHYRTAASRARRLQAEATTRWVKQHLRETIEQWERLAKEIEVFGLTPITVPSPTNRPAAITNSSSRP